MAEYERNFIRGVRLRERPPEGDYISSLPLIKALETVGELTFGAPVTFLVGENGTGKSTLLEAIAVASGFSAEGGSRDHAFSTRDTHSDLHEYLTVIRGRTRPADGFFLRAESFYNAASYLDLNSDLKRYGRVSLHEQSHGEAFMALVENRFEGNGIYLLDEPEAALSPNRCMSLICNIDRLVKDGSQLIIATHSPILMAYPEAEILQLSQAGIERVGYRETEHYRVTKLFLDSPERMIKYLLDN